MGRPPADGESPDTRDRLLSSALDAFGRKGFDAARLEDIAATAGISRPSLLYHFGTKAALYDAVVRDAFQELGDEIVQAIETDGPFDERLDLVLARAVRFLEARPALARLMLREMLDGRGPTHGVLLGAGLPVLDRIRAFVESEGQGVVRERIPVRAALMTLVSTIVNRVAAGPIRDELWGAEEHSRTIARCLLFEGGAR